MVRTISIIFFIVISSIEIYGQSLYWNKIEGKTNAPLALSTYNQTVTAYQLYAVKADGIRAQLAKVEEHLHSLTGLSKKAANSVYLDVPVPGNRMQTYRMYKSGVMSSKLQEKFPNIGAYVGLDPRNSNNRTYITVSKTKIEIIGVHGQETFYIQPTRNDSDVFVTYGQKNSSHTISPEFKCLTKANAAKQTRPKKASRTTSDGSLRKFRLAVATTGEYSQFHIREANQTTASEAEQKETVLAAVVTAINRVNSIYEQDLSIMFELIDNEDEILFLDPDQDSFTNSSFSSLIEESQEVIDQVIGNSNYDVGHTFSTSAGGLAQFNTPCGNSIKAKGITGLPQPVGDRFYIDFVCHELGHQFGANHVQNNDTERVLSTSVEPGSGSTVMGYAGISRPNIQQQGDPYFNAINLREILDFLQFLSPGFDCGVEITPTGNQVPEITDIEDYVIPLGTPFELSTEASDADADNLTYCWEQQDPVPAPMPPQPKSDAGPLFRSEPPSASPSRFLPDYEIVLNSLPSSEVNIPEPKQEEAIWEVIPFVARELNFSVTVRDNNPAGGAVAIEDVNIQVANTGPFRILTQNESDIIYDQNSIQQIQWDVAGTNENGINTRFVNILLSYDGGQTFPVGLARNTINDGSERIIIPKGEASTNCRIKIEPSRNIYYAVTTTDFEISERVRNEEGRLDEQVVIFPNPTSGSSVTVSFGTRLTEEEPIDVHLFDISGKLITSDTYTSGFETTLDFTNLATGMYVIQIVKGNETTVDKIIHRASISN